LVNPPPEDKHEIMDRYHEDFIDCETADPWLIEGFKRERSGDCFVYTHEELPEFRFELRNKNVGKFQLNIFENGSLVKGLEFVNTRFNIRALMDLQKKGK
jgi:hypothetical protein